MKKLCIPRALQIILDDFGWFYGKNELSDGGPARTGICRDHVEEDYLALNELGRKIGQKIVCGFTLGEWDKDNVLRGMPHATADEKGWDRAAAIDKQKARRFFQIIENSEYIDLAFHGLMHSYWVNGENYGNPREFYSYDLPSGAVGRRLDYPCVPVSAEYVDSHIEAWFKIYNGWGFTKRVETFISPAGLHRDERYALAYAEKIKKYGFKYWKNGWDGHDIPSAVLDTVIFMSGDAELMDFDALDVNPDALPDFDADRAVFAAHWPNFLRLDPKRNFEYLDAWADYFARQAERMGLMLSRDVAFAASQELFRAKAKITVDGSLVTFDLSEVYKAGAAGLKNEFYVSIRHGAEPLSVKGGEIEKYETHRDFINYKLLPNGEKIEIVLG